MKKSDKGFQDNVNCKKTGMDKLGEKHKGENA